MQSIVLSVCTTCLLSSLWLETYRTQHKIKKKKKNWLRTFLSILQSLPPNFIQLYRPPPYLLHLLKLFTNVWIIILLRYVVKLQMSTGLSELTLPHFDLLRSCSGTPLCSSIAFEITFFKDFSPFFLQFLESL